MVSTAKEDGFFRRRLPPEISFHGKTTRSERRRRRRSVARSTPSFGVADEKKQQQRWPSRSSAAVAVSLKQRRLAKWATEEQVPNPGLLPSTQFSANSQLTKT